MNYYPTEVECCNDFGELMFKLKTFDESSAELVVDCMVCNGNIDDLLVSIKNAFESLKLEG